MIPLLVPVVVLVAVTVHDLVRRPVLRRLALRNAVRRPAEAALVMVGSLLGTAIITAAFLVGDTLGASLRDFARTQLGPIDEAIGLTDLQELERVEAALTSPALPGADGVLALRRVPVAALTVGAEPRAEPHAALLEVDFDEARRFGGAPAATGLADAGPTPVGDEAVVTDVLARPLDLEPGDRLQVFAHGANRELIVRQVVPQVGVAGYWPAQFNAESPNVLVAPGTVAALTAAGTETGAPPEGWVFVSNDGGVFDGVDGTAAVTRHIEERLEGVTAAQPVTFKEDAVENADTNAAAFTSLFGGIGAFSVIAGILLLINVFVMLADERKGELGMLRAIGLRRNQLVRAFAMEGGLYGVVASVVGALLGIGVGRVIIVVAERLFNDPTSDFRVSLQFTVKTSSLATGFLLGAAISLLTVWGASARIGRLNVIRAIRDLPEPITARHHLRMLVVGALGVVAGGLLLLSGVGGDSWFGALAGVPIAAFAAIPLVARFTSRRAVTSAACLVALVWATFCFNLLPDVFRDPDISTFVVQGVILVAAAVILLAVNASVAVRLVQRLSVSNRALAARLGLAYPLARRFRTSMLLGMYGLVIFTLTFLSVFSHLFAQQAPRFTEEVRAGHHLLVDSNPGNPVTTETLEAQPEVASAAPLLRAYPEWIVDGGDPEPWPLAAYDRQLLDRGIPVLEERLATFADDRAVFEAVLADPSLVIVNDFFLAEGGGPPQATLDPGERITLIHPTTGARRQLTVVGLAASDWVFNGAMVGAPFARDLFGAEAVAARHYVEVRPGLDLDEAARRLTARLLPFGVDAESFGTMIRDDLRQNEGFFTLMQGYLALGLVIGIAGLGVVMVRAVRERRRQIGVLRALGFSHGVVRTAFLVEAVFIAVQGVVLGVGLALVVSYQLLTQSDVFGDQGISFAVPWVSLAILLAATLAASLAATLAPAYQASRIRPAVALRIAD